MQIRFVDKADEHIRAVSMEIYNHSSLAVTRRYRNCRLRPMWFACAVFNEGVMLYANDYFRYVRSNY